MKQKIRLDAHLLEENPSYSRQQIQSWIMQGNVRVNGIVQTKAGFAITPKDEIELIIVEPKYVCRAGLKLEKALEHFQINPEGLTVLDAGLSTGGFTDCLLQHGAAKVYGVDVGYGQVHEKIRVDPRVLVHERMNLRHLEDLGEKVDLVTLDLSFISLLKVIPAVNKVIKSNGQLITLIKPQFEAQKHEVGRGGLITDPTIHARIVSSVTQAIVNQGYSLVGITESPITGATGNKEFLAYFKRIA